MKTRPGTLLFSLCLSLLAIGQPLPDQPPQDHYRSSGNPYYWKNRPPRPGYWQQDVHYTMHIKLDEKRDVADGTVALAYWNNSPDTLRYVFFHLYQEAFNADSHMDRLRRSKGQEGFPEGRDRGTTLHSMQVDGTELDREQDNTIVKVLLKKPLPPDGSVTFHYRFTTHWGGMRRMKLVNAWGHKHYDGCHWYPRISVYDQRRGWDTQQHMNHELYGDFGTFDVALDMPNDMVVEATGVLQNTEEVMPADLRARLDLTNFRNKPWNEPPSIVTPYDPAVRKVWRYHAQNVHDFAFTADPTYRIGSTEWNGIQCIAVAQEPHASGWQNAADYCMRSVKALSGLVGPYAYPKMVVADAYDGMEYPMLTLDSGRDPDYRGLFVHEIGHNWFYGMVGNDETYRAMLDEGFTQFITALGLQLIDGDTVVADTPRTAYERRYTLPRPVMENSVYNGFMPDAVRDRLPPLNVHSDEFEYFGGGYRHVYYKTATMLYNLQYTLGDELFLSAFRNYFERWKMCHPTVEDFRQSFVDHTKVDLDWFFDQWIETGKRIDYAVTRVKGRNKDQGQEIHLRRKGDLQMPIDLTVVARDGSRHDFHIPNNWFVKKTSARVLPRWTGFDDLQRDHVVKVDIPTGIADVLIDTTFRLADAYQLDNSLRRPVTTTFDHHIANRPDRRTYEGFGRPDLWWNGYDGIKAGVHFHGDWMRYKHQVWFTAWLNTGLAQHLPPGASNVGYDAMNFNFRYRNGTERLLKGSSVQVEARFLDGLERYAGTFDWTPDKGRTRLYATMRFLLRRDSTDLTYLLQPAQWELNALNSSTSIGAERRYQHPRGGGLVRLDLRNSGIGAAMPYAQATLTATNDRKLGKLELRSRFLAQYGTGNTPRESALYLAGASPEDMMEDKFVRSVGMVPYEWTTVGTTMNHFHHGGGLGLRGYAGYLAPEQTSDGTVITTWYGNSGAAFNAELDLDGLVRFKPGVVAQYLHLDAYLFGDIGSMGYRRTTDSGRSELQLALPRADAGVGFALSWKKFGPLSGLKPFVLRFDMPLFLSHIPAGETDHFAFRYMVGIGRSF